MSDWIGSRTLDVELVDGAKFTARTIFADAVAYESTSRKHDWGSARDNTLLALAFVTWHALRRVGDIDKTLTFEAFRDQIAQVRPDTGADETPTGAGQQPD